MPNLITCFFGNPCPIYHPSYPSPLYNVSKHSVFNASTLLQAHCRSNPLYSPTWGLGSDTTSPAVCQMMAPLHGYLPWLAEELKPHFASALPPGDDAIWFDYRGIPLKW